MKNVNKYKIFAACTLVFQLVIGFAIFLKIFPLLQKINISVGFFIFLIVLLLISSAVFFLLIILLSKKMESKVFDLKSSIVSIDDNIEEEKIQENNTKSQEDIDIDHYLKKILPKDSSKLTVNKYTEKILSNFAKEFDIVQGLFFIREKKSDQFSIAGKYAYFGETDPQEFKVGQTLSGQAALNKTILNLSDIPDNYVTILSGLGSSSPKHLVIIPVIFNNETIAIIELASFKEFKKSWIKLFEELAVMIGESISKYIL